MATVTAPRSGELPVRRSVGLPPRFLRQNQYGRVAGLGRSRPAADASREVVERWLLDGLDVSVGHRRCSCDPFTQKDAGRTPAS